MAYREYNRSQLTINSDFAVKEQTAYVYNFPFTATLSEKKRSQGNPGYRNLRRAAGNVGGDFFIERSGYRTSLSRVYLTSGVQWFRGIQLPVAVNSTTMTSGMALPTYGTTQQNALLAMGTTAIARTIPTNPTSGVLQFAGELYRDGIPSILGSGLIKSRLRDYRELGSEYLNVEFGWKPFINDLKNMARAVKESDKILRQFHHNSGQLVHRGYSFPSYSETTVTSTPGSVPWPGSSYGKVFFGGSNPWGLLTVETTKSVDTWFEGCYRYYIPQGDSLIERSQRWTSEANKLLGLRLTPEVLWDLTPWTWLGDWVSNFGDVIHNISALGQDNLVMKYGYVMQHTKYERRAFLKLANPRLDGVGTYDLTYTNERKIRLSASPYGFGLTWNGFSPRQWAILGAIGISNGRKTSM